MAVGEFTGDSEQGEQTYNQLQRKLNEKKHVDIDQNF